MTVTAPAAVADKPVLHCFKCRDRKTYTRLLGSRPVYACDGCGNTREIEELGRVEAPAPERKPAAVEPSAPRSSHEAYHKRTPEPAKAAPREKRQMSDSKRSPLQAAIDAAVQRAVEPLKDEIAELRKQLDARDTEGLSDKDLDRKLGEKFETEVPELVNRALLQMLATPAGAAPRAGTAKAKRPRAPGCTHRGSCGQKCFGK